MKKMENNEKINNGEKPAEKKSSFYLIRTVSRQELNVALLLERKIALSHSPIYSIILPPKLKGYLVLESQKSSAVEAVIKDMQHLRKRVYGTLTVEDVERMIKPKATIETLNPGDTVEVIAGPFQGIKAQVIEIDKVKQEVVLNILESAYPLKVTIPGEFVKPVKKVE
ncbi:transcription elongation factor Spt5 [Fervidicoccus fontis]|uniref:Transcription elongation factor Spt5 n=2 Tax=Fervidicoccaceae TaxID=685949 RepID=A0A843AC13_9CREN|nr:transcription elongation factor Spt5 [Fervidicoccus fontis]